MAAPNEITPAQLNRLIGTPQMPEIIDLRIEEDFGDDPRLIPGAFRRAHDDLPALLKELSGKPVVVYCQKGRKISHGVAALLRNRGIQVETLAGGQFAWRDADYPMIDGRPKTFAGAGGFANTRWVTRHRPKIDRMACPWLIRRFIDPKAEFLFVPPQDVELVAEKFDAIPFDIHNVPLSHRGPSCTFDCLLAEYGLQSDPLDRIATVIRGADTNKHELSPLSAGLLAFSVGLSRMFRDDMDQLNSGMLLYDALYRWARDAKDEGHDWHPQEDPE